MFGGRSLAVLASGLMLSACDAPGDFPYASGQAVYTSPGYYQSPGYVPGPYMQPGYVPYGYQPGYGAPYVYGFGSDGRDHWHEHERQQAPYSGPHQESPHMAYQPHNVAPPAPQPPHFTAPQVQHNQQLLNQLGFQPSH